MKSAPIFLITLRAHHNPAHPFPQSRPNRGLEWVWDANQKRLAQTKGMGMTESELRLAREREEIAAHIARFRETQERFEREREEFFVSTWQRVRGLQPLPFWS